MSKLDSRSQLTRLADFLFECGMSEVTLKVRKDVKLTDDTIASVKTNGLIGDKYVKLSLGGGDPVKPGAVLRDT